MLNIINKLRTLPSSFYLLLSLGIILSLNNSWVEDMFFDGHLYMALGKNASELGYWLIPHLSKSTYPEFTHHTSFVFILEGLFFKLFGSSYTSGRIFSSLFYLGSFTVLYLWSQRKSKVLAFWSSFFFLIIPPLVKKNRYPGLDIPLMFFCLLSAFLFFRYLEEKVEIKRLKLALGAGFSWGCALLVKPPIAFFVPLSALAYLLVIRRKEAFQNFKSYLIPAVGLFLFSLWPLALWGVGKDWVFKEYLHFTFVHTAFEGRGIETTNPLYYFFYLIKRTGFIFPMALIGTWLSWKKEWNEGKYAFCFFFSLIFIMSFFTLKYSHYIIPLYPYLALLAGITAITYLPQNWSFFFINKITPVLTISVFIALAVFPLTNKSKRNPELQKIIALSHGLREPPQQWGIVEGAYSFYKANNLIAYRRLGEVFNINEGIFKKILREEDVSHLVSSGWFQKLDPKKWSLLVKKSYWEKAYQGKTTFKIIAHFKKNDLIFVVHESLLSNHLSF